MQQPSLLFVGKDREMLLEWSIFQEIHNSQILDETEKTCQEQEQMTQLTYPKLH